MDADVISAMIGALATVIAALIAALVAQRSGAARDRKQMAMMIDAATIVAQRMATTTAADERNFLEENLETLRQVNPRHSPKPETVALTTAESHMLLVVQYENPRPAFNIQLTILNNGDQVAVIDGMEAVLTGPDRRQQRFHWNLFYGVERGGTLHTLASYIHPVAIPAGEPRSLGIQFIGPDPGPDSLYNWPPGRYEVEVLSWVNRHRDDQPTNVKTGFSFDLSPGDIGQLQRWTHWDARDWARFPSPSDPDPHRAAGLPVYLDRE